MPASAIPLTRRQQEVLDYIRRYSAENGYPPTFREIGEHFAIRSTNGVSDHLRALERKGFLERGESKSRALRPLGEERRPRTRMVEVPLLGRVAAGQPILAVENAEETIAIDPEMLGGEARGEVFALRVRGDSMIEDGIFDGDVLFVRRQDTADAGDVVVALIGEEATVKRYRPAGDVVRFEPANAAMAPIVVRRRQLADVRILGTAVGVFRKLP